MLDSQDTRDGLSSSKAANRIRKFLAAIYGARDYRDVVLCPGELIALVQILHATAARSILLTNDEYYQEGHFAGMDVSICNAEDVARETLRLRPDAVLMSVVSWKGARLPVRQQFRQIRSQCDKRPLLLCDYAHAGAIGFPFVGQQNADIVLGDVFKWTLPASQAGQIGFIWAASAKLRRMMNEIFRGYYLASSVGLDHAARWVHPVDLLNTDEWLRDSGASRSGLMKRFRKNRACAAEVASALDIASPSASCILWIDGGQARRRVQKIKPLLAKNHVQLWETASGIRLLCSLEDAESTGESCQPNRNRSNCDPASGSWPFPTCWCGRRCRQ